MVIDTAKDLDTDSTRLTRRMPFLNMTAIHTTKHTTMDVILDLCHRPERIQPLREEIIETLRAHSGVKVLTLTNLKKLGSFIKESQRLNQINLSK